MDDIWHLADLTCREVFAGIPRKHADLMIELLERVHGNFASLEPMQPVSAVESLHSGRVNTGMVRIDVSGRLRSHERRESRGTR